MASGSSSTQKRGADMPEVDEEKRVEVNQLDLGPEAEDFYDGGTSDALDLPCKKTKFTVTKFPQTKVCAVLKPSKTIREQNEQERGLLKRLAKLKAEINDLSEDWDMIMRTPEISTIDTLHEKIEERDDNIFELKKEIATTDTFHKKVEEKDSTILRLKEENAKLKQDLAQQFNKIKTFEEFKSFMKLTLDLEASGTKSS